MLRTTITKLPRASLLSSTRAFTTTVRAMGESDTSGLPPRSGAEGDAFQRREHALEDWAIKQREKEKLIELKKKLAEQQAHLQKLSEHIDEITKEQGGEHN